MKEPQPGKLVKKAIMVAKSLHNELHPARIRRAEGGPVSLEDKFRHEINSNYAGAKRHYASLNNEFADTSNGRVLNVDMARELSPEYRASRNRSME